MIDREAIDGSVPRHLLRAIAELYVMTIPAVAIVTLLTTESGARGMIAAILLAPIALCSAPFAVRSVGASAAVWRKRRMRANVGRELLELGRDYRILSRCSVTPGREEHIAIGPNGIFVIVACNDGGRVTASSRRLFVNARLPWRDLIDDCRIDALRVRERVRRGVGRPLPVHSVLCFARALVAVGQEVQGVKVVQSARLTRLIVSIGVQSPLSEDEIESAATALTDSRRRDQSRPVARRPRRSRSVLPDDRRLAIVAPASARRRDG